jgi:single-stranded-DNA-specific exonuclease
VDAAKKWEAMDRNSDPVIVVESPDWHEGVIGIVAARMVERFHRPAIVISMKNGVGKGSGRSVPAFSLFDCVSTVESHLETFGGHAQACGLSIRSENVNLFRDKLNESAAKTDTLKQVDLEIDAELPFDEIDTQFLKDLEKLAPFGPGNKKPLFLSRGVQFRSEPKKRGKDTMQCFLTDKNGQVTCEAVGFRMFERWRSAGHKGPIDIVHQPSLLDYKGIVSVQLELEDWTASA